MIERLTGADASLYKATPALTASTSGTMTAGALYKIATISGTTVFPTGFQVGDIFLGDSAKTFNAGNSAYLMTQEIVADASEFSVEFSADEIEVTVLADDVKKYRKGKTDMSGSISGINFISQMQKAGSILNRFLKTATATSGNAITTLNTVDKSDMYGVFYLQDDTTTSGETMAVMVAQIELFGYNLGASVGDAQSWESGLRVIGNDPIVFFRPNA